MTDEIMNVQNELHAMVWNSLNEDQQIACFCEVVKRLKHGEITNEMSYRQILREGFGFESAYFEAQEAGFLEVHNAIKSKRQEETQLVNFAIECGVDRETAEMKLKSFNKYSFD